jgi:hypothetical protein
MWIQAAMLGTASNTVGQFSIQPGNANPFGVPISSPSALFNNGGVNALKIPFDYEVKELYLSVANCAVSTTTKDAVVYANIEFHSFTGNSSTSLGTAKVPVDPAKVGVSNNLGGNNFQSASLVGVPGIEGAAGDIIGFRFRNVSASTSNLNAMARCTILAKVQRKNWTPGGVKGETGAQGVTGLPGSVGSLGPQGLTGTQGVTGALGPTGAQGATGPQGSTGTQGSTGVRGFTGAPGDQVLWVQTTLVNSATNAPANFFIQPVTGGSTKAAPICSTASGASYSAGGISPIRAPWDYVVSEVHATVAHCAVSTTTKSTTVNLNLDFYGFTGSGHSLKGRVPVPLTGSLCGVSNNLGGDNYQFTGLTGLSSISGFMGELLGFQFTNVPGSPSDINALSVASVTIQLRKV